MSLVVIALVGFTLVLSTLKFTDNLELGWIWVTAPIWIPLAVILMLIITAMGNAYIENKRKNIKITK